MEYVYFIKFANEKWYKVGRSKNVIHRRNTLQVGSPKTLNIYKTWKGSKHNVAICENLLHTFLFKYAYYMRGEWYFIQPRILYEIMQFDDLKNLISYLKKHI